MPPLLYKHKFHEHLWWLKRPHFMDESYQCLWCEGTQIQDPVVPVLVLCCVCSAKGWSSLSTLIEHGVRYIWWAPPSLNNPFSEWRKDALQCYSRSATFCCALNLSKWELRNTKSENDIQIFKTGFTSEFWAIQVFYSCRTLKKINNWHLIHMAEILKERAPQKIEWSTRLLTPPEFLFTC